MHRIKDPRPDGVDAIGEIVQERVLGKRPEPAGVDKSRVRRRRREPVRQCGVVLTRVGRASSDVDQANHARVHPRFGDHGAGEGVTGQNRRPVLERQDAAGVRHIIGQ